jgi:P-type Cu+ transporter
MSIMVGTGRGAQTGVLIKNAEALESMSHIDMVVVDKTGTLTEGKPQISTVATTGWLREQELLELVASLEQASEHPLALAIVKGAAQRGMRLSSPQSFESVTGGGIKGLVNGRSVVVGTRTLMQSLGRHYQLGMVEQVRQNLEKANERVYGNGKVLRIHDAQPVVETEEEIAARN